MSGMSDLSAAGQPPKIQEEDREEQCALAGVFNRMVLDDAPWSQYAHFDAPPWSTLEEAP